MIENCELCQREASKLIRVVKREGEESYQPYVQDDLNGESVFVVRVMGDEAIRDMSGGRSPALLDQFEADGGLDGVGAWACEDCAFPEDPGERRLKAVLSHLLPASLVPNLLCLSDEDCAELLRDYLTADDESKQDIAEMFEAGLAECVEEELGGAVLPPSDEVIGEFLMRNADRLRKKRDPD